MRVFHLVKGLGRGGAETLLVRTAATPLRSPRRNAYGYFLPWKDALVPELQEQGCLVRCFAARNPLEMLLRLPELILFLRDWRPDLIHCHLPLAGVIGRLAGKILKVPVVYTEHNLQERYHPLTKFANKLTWGLQKRAIAVSAEVRDSIAQALPGQTPVQTVLNGVDCEAFSPNEALRAKQRKELGLSDTDFLVGTVAVFRKQKRLDLWLQVARQLVNEYPDIHFVMVGDGPERPMVEQLIDEYSLSSRVHLPGLSTGVQAFFCAMDVFFMSSDFEGLPVALLEAMACETPAVATRAGGIGEVIVKPEQGLLAEKRDVDSLAQHIGRLYSDRAFRKEIGTQGRARVQDAFSLERMNGELEELYGEVLNRSGRRERPKSLAGYDIEKGPSDEEALELIKASLGQGSERSPRTLEFFRWKHHESPFGESYALAVRGEESRELAGLRLFQRWNLICGDQAFSAVRAVDTGTRPDHQRKGIFTFLTQTALEEMAADGIDLVFNTPNKNSLPGYLKMGWELVAKVPVRVRMLSPRPDTRQSQLGQSLEEILERYSSESLDRLLQMSRGAETLQIEKNTQYLRWRYTGHPAMRYQFAAVGSANDPEALIVWCETTRFSLRELAVCELFVGSTEAARELLGRVLESSPCHYAVSAFFNSPASEEILGKVGFRQVPGKGIALTVHPLAFSGNVAVDPSRWALSTGDLQVF